MRRATKARLDSLMDAHEHELSGYRVQLAERSLMFSGHRALTYLHDIGLVDEATEKKIHSQFDS